MGFSAPCLLFANAPDLIQPRADFLPGNKTEANRLFNTEHNFTLQSVKLLISQVADRPKAFGP